MRLRTKLVLAAASVTFAIVLALSALFLSELLSQRIAQTAANNDVMARQVLMMTRQAVERGLQLQPPSDQSEQAFHASVQDALRVYQPLRDTMDALVRYSPLVQDVSVTDAAGRTLVSTDPSMLDHQAAERMNFERVIGAGVIAQTRQVFGRPRVLDVSMPLARNAQPFLVVHIGVRSTFLKNNYVPWLKDALSLVLLCGTTAMFAAALLASVALRPIEEISHRLDLLAGHDAEGEALVLGHDAVVRATRTIERLGEQIQTTEAGYTDLQANLAQMLDTLRDGVLLFTSKERAAMVSDAVANFVELDGKPLLGRRLTEIFKPETALGRAVLQAFAQERNVSSAAVRMEDGRLVEISVDHVEQGSGGRMGTLLTLRDTGSAMKLEKELEVSRRLAEVGRLTAGVGHEVKNPINAMVLHLELLRGPLAARPEAGRGAARQGEGHGGEMQRLDRVVQTLADFTRPMELHLSEVDLAGVAGAILELTSAEMAERRIHCECTGESVMVRADAELMRQALLNLVLNGMQSMPEGGLLRLALGCEEGMAVIEVGDRGTGIRPELMPRIFDLYFTTKPKGSGIGLAMTYRIVQMHGGSIEVQSQVVSREKPDVASGTTFTVRLPASFSQVQATRKRRARVAEGKIS